MEERSVIEGILEESGLWRGDRQRTHSYILSPDLYEVNAEQFAQIEQLGLALRDCLSGLGRIVATALNPKLASNRTWQMVGRAFCTGVPGVYRDIQIKEPGAIPLLCKVDLMQASDGRYYIAEIDGHNKHGLGYMALHAKIAKSLRPQAKTLPGVVAVISNYLRSVGENKLCFLYAHKERFYLPEFEILRDSLEQEGIELEIVDEVDVNCSGKALSVRGGLIGCRFFVDLPFMDKRPDLARVMADLYLSGEINFLLPPKPFLSSKAALAFLRNEQSNDDLESILTSQIPRESLEVIRRFIPPTYLVGKDFRDNAWQQLSQKGFVLKETISSGMKGTLFVDDARFEQALAQAFNSTYRFVLQREVTNESMRFRYFESNGEVSEDTWFSRIIVQFAGRQVADIELTARKDKRVHGAPDCLQLGAILV